MANILATKSHSHKINTNIMQIYGPPSGIERMKYRIFVSVVPWSLFLTRSFSFAISISCFVSLAFLHIQFIHRLYIFMQRFRLYGEWEVESIVRAPHAKCVPVFISPLVGICAIFLSLGMCVCVNVNVTFCVFRTRAQRRQNLTPCPSCRNIKRQYHRFT